jgi:hypothetical protein
MFVTGTVGIELDSDQVDAVVVNALRECFMRQHNDIMRTKITPETPDYQAEDYNDWRKTRAAAATLLRYYLSIEDANTWLSHKGYDE